MPQNWSASSLGKLSALANGMTDFHEILINQHVMLNSRGTILYGSLVVGYLFRLQHHQMHRCHHLTLPHNHQDPLPHQNCPVDRTGSLLQMPIDQADTCSSSMSTNELLKKASRILHQGLHVISHSNSIPLELCIQSRETEYGRWESHLNQASSARLIFLLHSAVLNKMIKPTNQAWLIQNYSIHPEQR